jgi:hypothetical protein
MIKRALDLAGKCVVSGRKGAEASRDPKNWPASAAVYAAFLLAYLFFFRWKPADFPEPQGALPTEPQDLLFWLKVSIWQPPLELAWIAFLLGFSRFFREGTWGLRMAVGVLWTAAPFIAIISYKNGGIPKAGLALAVACWLGAFAPFLRKAAKAEWLSLGAFMLALNAIGIVLLVPMWAAVVVDKPELFTATQAVGGLWILGWGTVGLRELTGLRLPRAFMAMLFSMFLQIALAFSLHMLDLVPKDILKALFYA